IGEERPSWHWADGAGHDSVSLSLSSSDRQEVVVVQQHMHEALAGTLRGIGGRRKGRGRTCARRSEARSVLEPLGLRRKMPQALIALIGGRLATEDLLKRQIDKTGVERRSWCLTGLAGDRAGQLPSLREA